MSGNGRGWIVEADFTVKMELHIRLKSEPSFADNAAPARKREAMFDVAICRAELNGVKRLC
jgi:hypothetical protein